MTITAFAIVSALMWAATLAVVSVYPLEAAALAAWLLVGSAVCFAEPPRNYRVDR